MALAGEFLEAREAENNLIFGICSAILADPTQYEEPPFFAVVLEMVRATVAHRPLIIEWLRAFNLEAMGTEPTQDLERAADRGINGVGRELWLWVDEGRPVSLTGVGGLTPRGIRVGPVYTPPEGRARGYASNLVAGVSQRQLDAGRQFVFLFTDLANPTANHIYQAIGYEPVVDMDEYSFDR
jgi:predicted GNAT family acetyltransferase